VSFLSRLEGLNRIDQLICRHPEELDEEDDDGDVQLGDAPNGVPHAPLVPVGLANGTSV